MKTIKIILIILIALGGLLSGSLYLLSLGTGNGGLGSSYPQYTNLTLNKDERDIGYEIYKESCAKPVSQTDFTRGLTEEQAKDCNSKPNGGGISFVGENGNEMYLLSHNRWDRRVLYAAYYLLQRGFTGPDKYSLRMDCSAPGFEAKPKMTLGVHYGRKGGTVISYIKSIANPEPNLDVQYVSSGSEKYSPEGTESQNNSNAISPHAYGQGLDVYSYGCTSTYVRLDSDESAAKWACGYTKAANTVYYHTYFYPIINIKNEIGYSSSTNEISSNPENGFPDAKEPYRLSPKPDLRSCSSGPVQLMVNNTCNPAIPSMIPITYSNAGCIAQNQPNLPQSYYKSSYFYGSPKTGFYSEGNTSRVQAFQYPSATWIPSSDQCSCIGTSVPQNVPDGVQSYYSPKAGPLTFLNANLGLTIPPEQKKGLSEDGLKSYIQNQAEEARKIVIEAAMVFSLAKKDGSYKQANEYFENLVSNGKLPDSEMTINQISAPTGGSFTFPAGYNPIALLIYGANKSGTDYDPNETAGRRRGLGYNATDMDRVHLGF